MPIKLNTASGGGVILTGANTASDKTITVPADDGTMIYANSSGNVGIGTSSPDFQLQVEKPAASTFISVVSGTSNTAGILLGDTDSATVGRVEYDNAGNFMSLYTNGSERARIDSSGNLLVNCTIKPSVGGAGSYGLATETGISVAGVPTLTWRSNTTTATDAFYFYTSSALVGFIRTSGSTTTYSTTSDYRLKENVQPMTGALAKVAALKPCTYTWKLDGSAGEGFIAHELAEVVPDCVSGEKDAVNEDGSIKPQGIDTSFLVSTLTAAIQEQQQMIETLQAKVAALEAK